MPKSICISRALHSSTDPEEILTMKTNGNEINIHLLLANDIDRVRQIGKTTMMIVPQRSIDRMAFFSLGQTSENDSRQFGCRTNSTFRNFVKEKRDDFFSRTFCFFLFVVEER